MKILEYTGLDIGKHKAQYQKILDALARDDFRQAEVKKLANIAHGKFYRAKLDAANRLLFSLVRHEGTVYALMLEVIENHAYDKSRFLRGAEVDEDKLPAVDSRDAVQDADPVRYIHPDRREIHLLDKVISFDDAQEAVYRLPPPLIVVGSAGSGKTALTLEKLKHTEGEVLYVTHSAYLAQSARDLYYGHGFDKEGQDTTFFSYREFLESLQVPEGREAGWRDFAAWFGRMRQQFKGIEAHQAFEEIRGVIAADAGGVLARETYRDLGVRQSIFPQEQRDPLYDLFEKYRAWLAEAKLYDLNLVAHEWTPAAAPRYDFVVVDEVQDLTTAQLALILKTLKKPGHFLLCGDSNQIVHPNFFSWSKVKSLFWRDPELAARQELRVLRANFRNSHEATRVANTLLKIKHRRFGSIDRESNFLVDAVAGETGAVTVLNDKDAVKKELNQKTKSSTQFAVLVMRDEDKAEARRFFQTPLIFSIHEAKGLEYENIILYRFVSDHRAEFSDIAEGVTPEDLKSDDLEYRRAKDKADKSLEIYKFYINALYVALTRAIQNVYLIESDSRHPLLGLLDTRAGSDKVEVAAKNSTLDDWQREARKLELQGKQEQADAIRANILKQTPVPWPVFDEARLRDTLVKVFREQVPGSKLKQQLYEYATCYDETVLAVLLGQEAGYEAARNFHKQRATLGYKYLMPYYGKVSKEVLQQCERHGIDHRTAMNLTPLMAASVAGNVALVEALLERGANPELTDHLGRNALHWAMVEAFREPKFAKGPFAAIYERIAPTSIDLRVGGRLVRIDRHLTEYFLFQTLWAQFRSRFLKHEWGDFPSFDTGTILETWQHLPKHVLKPERNKRQHLSNVLSRNEMDRDYAYNRRLFKRMRQGWYLFNPELSIRRKTAEGETWVPVYEALNLKLVKEFAQPPLWAYIDNLLNSAGIEPPEGVPVACERRERRLQHDREAEAAARARMQADAERKQREREEEARRMLEAYQRQKPAGKGKKK
ncbi:Superfamily I DNA or RNA helicase [Methylomagnum ishizawai]|uniref:Superfamily I DNA or RNA helicase n=1 Tax=Methylomagnum ishizawai TaxID=1760988 RepID=A0A1Y6CYT3_9GAMM|nr:UvrD-helicase domain-containing protein [Methylomagnum ishizawai]SMF95829.1 Superfamily I DNA or RNA helicase [Methylomagnum ishizawai]